jgi:hypothetical protein
LFVAGRAAEVHRRPACLTPSKLAAPRLSDGLHLPPSNARTTSKKQVMRKLNRSHALREHAITRDQFRVDACAQHAAEKQSDLASRAIFQLRFD